ncbi:hypothetical protein BSKO_05389 [Bryopsis sp. KO-2023]|nr:hypothetical protein BSKO_05389 [Bryopsis sp. KO-2023]
MKRTNENSENLRLLPTLIAFANALFPKLPTLAAEARLAGDEDVAVFYETQGDYSPELLMKMLEVMESKLPSKIGSLLIGVLKALGYRWGTFILCGWPCLTFRPPFVLTFAEMAIEERQNVLGAWANSRISLFTAVFRGLKAVVAGVLMSGLTSDGLNRLWPGLKYPHPSTVKPKSPPPDALRREKIIQGGLVDLASMATSTSPADVKTVLAANGLKVSEGLDGSLTVDCDAVVVGSGAGGGTAAAILSQSGMRVLVVEKGSFLKMGDMSWVEQEAFQTAYESEGFFSTDDGGVSIMAGASLGGGTRINWCASLRTPFHVRKEWSEAPHSLSDFSTSKYEASMDAVCQRLGVHQDFNQNAHGKAFKKGFESLGCHVENMPRNCKSKDCSSFCCFGCASGDKQDGVNTYLLDAVENGAKILTGCRVETIITEAMELSGTRSKRAKGVKCNVELAEGNTVALSIRSDITITACGSLNSPALLLRSGITCNQNVGKNLRLHPAVGVLGCFPETSEEGSIRLWEGAMMSAYSKEFANWDSKDSNYGPLVSLAVAHPGITMSVLPWYSAEEFKKMVSLYKNAVVAVVLCRDEDSGEVSIDSDGNPVVHYWPSKRDRDTIVKGVEAGLRGLRAAGAMRLQTTNASARDFIGGVIEPQPIDDQEFETFLQRIRKTGIQKFRTPVFSAHQMGSCRMGACPKTSVADGNGETWEVENLFVCDASAFPTSSGANPMITTQSISHMNASDIVARCEKKRVAKRHITVQAET